MPWFEPASIFLGALGGTALLLILVYLCMKRGLCFCDLEDGRKTTEVEAEYAPLATEDDGADSVLAQSVVSSPPAIPISEQAKHIAQSNPELELHSVTDSKQHLTPPKTNLARNKSQSLENFGGFPKISLTLQYSRKDMFLVVAIHEVVIEDQKVLHGCNQVRINGVILPDKKFRVRTRYINSEKPEFDTKYKFSNVSRSALFQSSFRFRLYARTMRLGIQAGRERCISEVTIHLADVAQRDDALKTFRPMSLKVSSPRR